MIDRLNEVLDRLEHLPQSEQEEVAEQLERLLALIEHRQLETSKHSTSWRKLIGVWAADDVDTAYAELDRIRHDNPASPPIQLP